MKPKKQSQKKKAAKTTAPPAQKNQGSRLTQGKLNSRQNLARSVKQAHHTTVCSVTDPFCIHARGAQHPEGGPPTISLPLKALVSLSAYSTAGALRYSFVANPAYPLLTYSKGAGTVWNASGTFGTVSWNNTLMNDYAKEVRITSFGASIRSQMTATTAKGTVIATHELATPTLSSSGTPYGVMMGETATFNLGSNTEFSFVAKPQNNAKLFRPWSDYTSSQTNTDWSGFTIEVNNGDTTTDIPMLVVELFMNIEFTLQSAIGSSGTGLAQLSRYPPPPNPIASRAADRVYAKTPAILDAAASSASSYISKMAGEALDEVMKMGLALL